MSLGQLFYPHLPWLRRYARALTGRQSHGDSYARATLDAIVAAPHEFSGDVQPRLALYRKFHALWSGSHADPAADAAPGGEAQAAVLARQALLLTAMEGFSHDEAAYLIGCAPQEIDALVKEALRETEHQTRAEVLIIEDEPAVAMDIEMIVRDMGHCVSSIAVTHDEALHLAKSRQPGLVLADLRHVDASSGLDAVADILAHFPVPVIFLTAFPERLLTGERPEPTFLIAKPFQRATVQAAISQALSFGATAILA